MLSGILEMPDSAVRAWMVFSHCFTCNKDLKAIVRIARGLAQRGWGVLRYDFAGLGGSEGTFADTNFSTNCEDLCRAVEFLSGEHHPPRFLFGLSFGGAASLAMADSLPSIAGVITLAAPSDTSHLADLLASMNPRIEAEGQGTVVIGGFTHTITRQMLDDFRREDLPGRVRQLRKAILAFHSPEDETVSYRHALANSGFAAEHSAASGLYPRSLITLPGSNHLLTSSERDIDFVVGIMDAWCDRLN
ncbi:MAG: alpha/beta hydrolase [Planctomycetota bacterium]|jgi:esterase/lipase